MRQLKNYRSDSKEKVDGADSGLDDAVEKYVGMDENELLGELMKNVSAAKSNGSFSAEQLDDFVSFVSPSLDEEAARRLSSLVGMIKGE